MTTSFPRQHARTRRFTLGVPRGYTLAPDGSRLLFLRTRAGDDPVTALWYLDLTRADATEQVLVDPDALGGEAPDQLPPAERARRERAREMAGGVTAYATDEAVHLAAFALGGRLCTVAVPPAGADPSGPPEVVEHPTAGPVFDPRPSPDGRRIAYVSGDALHLVDLVGGPGQPGVTRPLAMEEGASWGRAEFVAAEEMGRARGTWWAPDGERLAVARVDESPVPTWHLADPARPDRPAQELRYPAAGTVNADVRLVVLGLDGRHVDVAWDREALPYLTRVSWDERLTVQVQSRDQRRVQILTADPDTGATTLVREIRDDAWVELVPGSPAWLDGRLCTVEDRAEHGAGGSRALCVDGEPVTPPGLQVRSLAAVGDGRVVLTASGDDPTQTHVWVWRPDAELERWSPAEPGVHAAGAAAGEVRVLATSSLATPRPQVSVTGPAGTRELAVRSEEPVVAPQVELLELGPRRLRAALLLPADVPADARLPVLLDPYGGPHAQRVVRSRAAFLTSQWFADQGFAVLVVDGRGTPGRGPAWERAVRGDLATPVLEDQLDALHAAAAHDPRLDLTRVAIRGWSFGGYLAALAVLRRPDVVRAAVAGAPVTDWSLYDTHYTERYLGDPATSPASYRTSSLVDADGRLLAARPWDGAQPPALLLIHGLADDNVVAAHSLRLSAALLADGRPHTFLPLSGVTHMTPQEVVAEQLLRTQVRFLRDALG